MAMTAVYRGLGCLLLMLPLLQLGTCQCSGSSLVLTAYLDSQNYFTSPNYPSDYPNNANCVWSIESPPNTYIVMFVDLIYIERNYDFVRAYEDDSPNAIYLGEFTSSPFMMTSTGNSSAVKFTSDHSVTRAGFRLAYYAMSKNTGQDLLQVLGGGQCGGSVSLAGSVGDIHQLTSTSFPQRYQTAINPCVVTLNTSSSVKLTVVWMDDTFLASTPCGNGGLDIRDNSNLFLSICNYATMGFQSFIVYSSATEITLSYKSTSSEIRYGPVIAIEYLNTAPVSVTVPEVQTTQPLIACGSTYTARRTENNTLSSRGFPDLYPNNERCGYLITAENSSDSVFLSFLTLSTESSYDTVSVYDGPDGSFPILAVLSGEHSERQFQSLGRSLYLYFSSDNSVRRSGFNVLYYSGNSYEPSCSSGYTKYPVTSDTRTVNSHPGFGGVSGHYSNNYFNYWLFEKPNEDSTMTFYFKSFKLESSISCTYDYVRIYDGPCTDSAVLHSFCGSNVADVRYYHRYGKYVLMQFRTDSSVTGTGFQMAYSIWSEPSTSKSVVNDSSSLILKIIGGIIPVIVLITIITIVYCCKCRSQVSPQQSIQEKPKLLSKQQMMSNLVFVPHVKQKVQKWRKRAKKSQKRSGPSFSNLVPRPVTKQPVQPPPPPYWSQDPAYPPVMPAYNPNHPNSSNYTNFPSPATNVPPQRIPSVFTYVPPYA